MGLIDNFFKTIQQTTGFPNDRRAKSVPTAVPAPNARGVQDISPLGKVLLALLAAKNIRGVPFPTGGGLDGLFKGPVGGLFHVDTGTGAGGGLFGLLRGQHKATLGADAGMILNKGLGDLLKQLQQSGQGDLVNSWVSSGPNRPIPQHDLQNALGAVTLDAMADQSGIQRDELLAGLSYELPRLVDAFTPHGRLLTDEEAGYLEARKVFSALAELPAESELPAEFTPSESLVLLFHKGLMAHYGILRDSHENVDQVPTMEWARARLPGRILEVIASRAWRMQAGELDEKSLFESGAFDYGFVLELSEHVPFRIDEGQAFFIQLHEDIKRYLRSGGEISGPWGRLVLDGERIAFELNEHASHDGLSSDDGLQRAF